LRSKTGEEPDYSTAQHQKKPINETEKLKQKTITIKKSINCHSLQSASNISVQ